MTEKRRQGFATLPAEKRSEIASQGGRAAHAKGTAHTWDTAAAKEAGRKGGLASWQKRSGAFAVPFAKPAADDAA